MKRGVNGQGQSRVRASHVATFVDESEVDHGFLATYADLVTLLLALFVMLYATSDTNIDKFRGAAASLRSALIGKSSTKPIKEPKSVEAQTAPAHAQGIDALMKDLDEGLSNTPVRLFKNGDRVRIRLDDEVLFQSGSAELVPTARAMFGKISAALGRHKVLDIRIEGHTDDRPISTSRYPSNWELSAIRATTVLRLLIDLGIEPRRLTATGYADLLPLAPNDSDGNRAKNRRVELVLEMEAQE